MGCSDILLIIVQVIALLVDCFAIAGLIWQLTLGGIPWNLWILSLYVVFFCLFQLLLELWLPRLVWVVLNIVTRFWGLGMLYVLTGIICVAVGNPSSAAPAASVMCFAAGGEVSFRRFFSPVMLTAWQLSCLASACSTFCCQLFRAANVIRFRAVRGVAAAPSTRETTSSITNTSEPNERKNGESK
jgi:hypothetical protein